MSETKKLTMSEKALLNCLAAGAGETVTYETLACEGLGFLHAGDASETLVRQHVHNLRAKLEEGSIETVQTNMRTPGGYRLAGALLRQMVRFEAEEAAG